MFTAPELRVGKLLTHHRLSVFPIYLAHPSPASYRLADDALADGTAVVEEISEGGSVPSLAVENKGDSLLLFLEGQELRGAKQNRVLNTSVLISAHVKTLLPVSCVEQGRWRYTSKHFASSGMHSSSKLRGVLKKSVNSSTMSGRGHDSDQGEVWQEVRRQMGSLGSSSPTMAMGDTFEAHREQVTEHVERLVYPEGAAGLAVAVGGKVVSVDVFDTPDTCRKVWPRLLTGVVLDAVEESEVAKVDETAVRAAVEALATGPWQSVTPAGTGEEYRGEPGGKWHGSVLALNGALVHGSLVLAG